MKVNSIRSTRGYPRQICLKFAKASNKPLCFHDFGKIPLCQLQQDLLAHHDSHPQHTVKHNAFLTCSFFLLLTAKSIHRQDTVTFRLQSLVWSQTEVHAHCSDVFASLGSEAHLEMYLAQSASIFRCTAGTWSKGKGHYGMNLCASNWRGSTAWQCQDCTSVTKPFEITELRPLLWCFFLLAINRISFYFS